MSHSPFTQDLLTQMSQKGVDPDLTDFYLRKYREIDEKRRTNSIEVTIPEPTHPSIVDRSNLVEIAVDTERLRKILNEIGAAPRPDRWGKTRDSATILSTDALRRLGVLLLPFCAYGVLNGGSATSYADHLRNEELNPALYSAWREPFERLSAMSQNRPKGLAPAFLHPDGTPGPCFLELKMRALLLQILAYEKMSGKRYSRPFPFFQMTSVSNDAILRKAYAGFSNSPYLRALFERSRLSINDLLTGIQPLITAFTPDSEPAQRTVFTDAAGRILPLPGGHGQSFSVLKNVYRELHSRGIRFVCLGNVDNLASTIDPVNVALLSLKGNPGGFEFSYKTAVDKKGGILVQNAQGQLDCSDIGAAIPVERVRDFEDQGKAILFNCATGLFDLDSLVNRLDSIIQNLPIRYAQQNKDIGRYTQAEQVTWEVLGLMDHPIVFAVEKKERFLAAKFLLETMLSSDIPLPRFSIENRALVLPLLILAVKLRTGMHRILSKSCGLVLRRRRWVPSENTRLA